MAEKWDYIWKTDQKSIDSTQLTKTFDVIKGNHNSTIVVDFNPCSFDDDNNKSFPSKNCKINPFGIKLILNPNWKNFIKSAILENFNPKPRPRVKNLISKKDAALVNGTKKQKRSVSNSFIHVWDTFENQVQYVYASQKIQVLYNFRKSKTQFRYVKRPEGAGAWTSITNILQNTFFLVHEVEYQKTLNAEETSRSWFSEVIEEIFRHSLRKG